jgi:hypothetical protein
MVELRTSCHSSGTGESDMCRDQPTSRPIRGHKSRRFSLDCTGNRDGRWRAAITDLTQRSKKVRRCGAASVYILKLMMLWPSYFAARRLADGWELIGPADDTPRQPHIRRLMVLSESGYPRPTPHKLLPRPRRRLSLRGSLYARRPR